MNNINNLLGYYGNLTATANTANGYNTAKYNVAYQCGFCREFYPINTMHVCSAKQEKEMGTQSAVASSYTQAIEIIYRYGNERVKTTLIKGVNDVERAEELFLAQFGDEDDEDVKHPDIIAAVEVLVAA